jgi:hypothetical protein
LFEKQCEEKRGTKKSLISLGKKLDLCLQWHTVSSGARFISACNRLEPQLLRHSSEPWTTSAHLGTWSRVRMKDALRETWTWRLAAIWPLSMCVVGRKWSPLTNANQIMSLNKHFLECWLTGGGGESLYPATIAPPTKRGHFSAEMSWQDFKNRFLMQF